MRRPSLGFITVLPLGFITALLISGCIGAGQRKPDDLKVTRAVLYQNGIGYFERRGKVQGQQIKLRILPAQIADVLKSLTVVDLKDGRAINVALPVEKTRVRQLAALPAQVRQGGGIISIAQAFRGARAEVRTSSGSGEGRLVGVEKTTEEGGWRLSLLTEDGVIKSFEVDKVESLEIQDRTLEVGLRKALDISLDEGSWKPVELSIHLAGETPHDLLVSYVVEMPTWKPAYRVVLSKGEAKGLLQGWAVVDNVSGEDWNRVSLSLTAGTPLTFTYDLYSPRFIQRPDLSPPQEAMAEAPPPPTDGAAPPAPPAVEEAREAEAERGHGAVHRQEEQAPPQAPPEQQARQLAAAGSAARAAAWSPPRHRAAAEDELQAAGEELQGPGGRHPGGQPLPLRHRRAGDHQGPPERPGLDPQQEGPGRGRAALPHRRLLHPPLPRGAPDQHHGLHHRAGPGGHLPGRQLRGRGRGRPGGGQHLHLHPLLQGRPRPDHPHRQRGRRGGAPAQDRQRRDAVREQAGQRLQVLRLQPQRREGHALRPAQAPLGLEADPAHRGGADREGRTTSSR